MDISATALDRSFQYRIPKEMEDQVHPGSRVDVPFNRRVISGYVVGLGDEPLLEENKILPIHGFSPRGIGMEDELMRLAFWMKERYGCTLSQAFKTVLPVKKQVKKGKSRAQGAGEKRPESAAPVALNEDQQRAALACLEEMDGAGRPSLLFGITGSGKTEVYMALIEEMRHRGKQSILLIPEIALTYQNLRRFYQRFGQGIGLIHSRQSQGEKSETVEKARRGELDLVIGPRSALFTPLPDLGLIIVDEEHDESYRSELSPRYHSVEVARKRAEISGAGLVLGSATPSLESFLNAKDGNYQLLRLPKRAVAESLLPRVHVTDLRQEMAEGNKSIFSRLLKEKMEGRLAGGQQIMLFLNRRGYAGFVNCRSCGKVFRCPHCDVSLTFHRGGRLKCHLCGYQEPFPETCPACGSPYVAAFGAGTQKVESLIQKEFPTARVLRMDADTTRGKTGHEKILSVFAHGGADILIGTQMIVKGHDFPRVSLVGILAADLSLYHADFKAAEQTFALLTQAAGRAGRASLPGEVVIQTYTPEHYAIRCAAAQDYEGFFEEEMERRRLLNYPPACGMLRIVASGPEEAETEGFIRELAEGLRTHFAGEAFEMIGPAPHERYKAQDLYRQTLYIKQKDRGRLSAMQNFACSRAGERIQTDIY